MIGFRGASRYYNKRYKPAFALECAAIKKVRDQMGLTNVKVMVPFVRTVEEAKKVLEEMKKNGLKRKTEVRSSLRQGFGGHQAFNPFSQKLQGKAGVDIIMMCEIPSNPLLIDQFSKYFDGFSIGSNDLTQLTLGVDRDSEILAPLFDERDEAVKKMMRMAIEGAKNNAKDIGICGQAPSDLPEIANFLIECGITSISLSPDAIVQFLMRYAKK